MSSHHIIREKQEPALFILNHEGFSGEHLGQLLEWSPTVVVTAENYEQVDSLGIKIDAMVAPEAFMDVQPAMKMIIRETSPLDDGLSFLITEGYSAVNIITGAFHAPDYDPFTSRINLVIYLPAHKIFPVTPGFSKWKEAGEIIELVNVPPELATSGLKQLTDHRYETTGDGFYSLSFNSRLTFIKEHL